MEIIFNEKGATFKPIKCTKVHKKWHAKIKFTFNEKNATIKLTKFTKSNIKWLGKVEFIFNERNIIPKPTKSTKVYLKWYWQNGVHLQQYLIGNTTCIEKCHETKIEEM